jgi:ABC-2 type transport system ATP-binding protein
MLTIETQNLSKHFGDKIAVEDLSLNVEQGEVFGFLGPNGAGKTTSIKMLLGLVLPTAGTANLLGKPIGDPSARAKVGFLPEHFRFHEWLTATEFLHLHANLYGMSRTDAKSRVPQLLELVGMTAAAHRKIQTFSKGMQQRVGLAQALLNRPQLVILDEPTSGLDPVGRRMVRDIIQQVKGEGTTVFLNSHLLSEIEVTCDRVAFIRQGKVIRVSDLNSLSEGELTVSVRVRHLSEEAYAGLTEYGRDIRRDGDHFTITLNGESDLPRLSHYLIGNGADLYALKPNRLSLEELFIQIVGTETAG